MNCKQMLETWRENLMLLKSFFQDLEEKKSDGKKINKT